MSGHEYTTNGTWPSLFAEVVGARGEEAGHQASARSFTALGGTSLGAVEFLARIEDRLGLTVPLAELLGPAPLAEVMARAVPCAPPPVTPPRPAGTAPCELLPGQRDLLSAASLFGDRAYHLLFSAEIESPLERERLLAGVAWLTARHETLRTVFVHNGAHVQRRVLASHKPAVTESEFIPGDGSDAVAALHAQYGRISARFLDPYERPPVHWVLTTLPNDRRVLTLLIHHALVDGWSVGLLWRDLFDHWAGQAPQEPAPTPEAITDQCDRGLVERRAAQLADAPLVTELPGDAIRPPEFDGRGDRLRFGLSPAAADGCATLATRYGLTTTVVMLAAWSAVVARRTGAKDFLLGVPVAGRGPGLLDVAGLCTRVVPVRCRPDDSITVAAYLRATAQALADAVTADRVPLARLADALDCPQLPDRNPLVQLAFAAHDELIPTQLHAGDITAELQEGHCGGAIFDAMLYVQRMRPRPLLAIEYATSLFTPAEVAALAAELDTVLTEFAAAPEAPLAEVRAVSAFERERLNRWSQGPPFLDRADDAWTLVARTAEKNPEAIAVRSKQDGQVRELTYRQLVAAAEMQAAQLARAGVSAGGRIVVELDRSAQEIVAILGVLRLGAAYAALDTAASTAYRAGILERLRPDAVLAHTPLPEGGVQTMAPVDPWAVHEPPHRLGERPTDPDAVAYTVFTSGSTGEPKGVCVPHRGIVRLVRDTACVTVGPGECFLRLAPLAFDAATLEIFAPLAAGGTIEVHPPGTPSPAELAAFLRERGVSAVWLTAGLFALVATYRPDAFDEVRHVLTGGDVVPPGPVRALLERLPGLTITNGYGPTENTTFTTVQHFTSPAQIAGELPIGRPITGTTVHVLDDEGRPVPPGAVGELHTGGAGLALGYLDDPARTTSAFGRTGPDGQPLYRTGDLVRWDGQGRLCFIGRRDRQVKVAGQRVELAPVHRLLTGHPRVQEAVVLVTGTGAADRRLLAAVVPVPGHSGQALAAELRKVLADVLPSYAVPSLWAVLDALPLTPNGKNDTTALTALATDSAEPPPTHPDAAESPGADVPRAAPGDAMTGVPDELEEQIRHIWQDVLGIDDIENDESFFDTGGDSLQLASVRTALMRALPSHPLTIMELYRHPTIRDLAAYLRTREASCD